MQEAAFRMFQSPASVALVLAVLAAGCGDGTGPDDPALAVTTRPPAELAAGLEHALDVVVRITDEDGPVVGAAATWTSGTAGDSVTADLQTDAEGLARGTWYIGPSAGQHTLTVGATGTEATTIVTSLEAFQPEKLSVGHQFACGLRQGAVWCWSKRPDAFLPARIAAGWTFTDVDVETEHACGLTDDGSAVCWDRSTMTGGTSPAEVTGAPELVQLAVAERYVCGLTATGQPWCSGEKYPATGAEITGAPPLWKLAVATESAQDMTACGLSQVDSTAWCWGSANHGALGNGTTVPSYDVAQQVSGGQTFNDIAGSSVSFCAVQLDRHVACWGYGSALPGFGSDQVEPTTFREMADSLSGAWFGYLGISPDGPDFWGGYLDTTDPDSTFSGLEGITTYDLGTAPCVIQDDIGVSCSIGLIDEIQFHDWQRLRPFVPVPEPDLVP